MRVLVDAPVFIYHFTSASPQCRDFLKRCESGEIHGLTSVVTLAEVTHRLMMIEAVLEKLVSPGNVVQKLRKKPGLISQLTLYQEQVDTIVRMNIEIIPLDLAVFSESGVLRTRHGLLTNDSLLLATAAEREIAAIATADEDFARIEEVELFYPSDI
jgi:predicted nucleic acid-binding protein